MSGGGLLGGLFGGSSSQTTQSTTSAPWKEAQPALKTGLAAALKQFNLDPTGQNSVYTGSTVVPWDAQTIAGQNSILNAANANNNGQGISGQFQSIINNGGYNAAQQQALQNTQNVANSSFDINSDPGFQQVVDAAKNSVNGSASAAGRYGSGIHQQTLANTIGDLGARQYQNFLARKDSANSNLFNMGAQGQSNLSNAYSGLSLPAQDLMKVGSQNEDLQTRTLNDQLRIFQAKQSAPWDAISRLNAVASGAGQLGSTQTVAQPGQNPFLTSLGYGLSGAGLLGSFF